jgi:hypothetical protein
MWWVVTRSNSQLQDTTTYYNYDQDRLSTIKHADCEDLTWHQTARYLSSNAAGASTPSPSRSLNSITRQKRDDRNISQQCALTCALTCATKCATIPFSHLFAGPNDTICRAKTSATAFISIFFCCIAHWGWGNSPCWKIRPPAMTSWMRLAMPDALYAAPCHMSQKECPVTCGDAFANSLETNTFWANWKLPPPGAPLGLCASLKDVRIYGSIE